MNKNFKIIFSFIFIALSLIFSYLGFSNLKNLESSYFNLTRENSSLIEKKNKNEDKLKNLSQDINLKNSKLEVIKNELEKFNVLKNKSTEIEGLNKELEDSIISFEENKTFKSFICPVSIMVQKMLTTFIESGEFEKHLNRMRKIYSKKRQLLIDMLSERKDITIRGADAGLHLVLEYPKTYSEEEIIKKAKEKKIKDYGLGSYGTKREIPSILLGFATLSEEKLKEGIKLFLEI